MPAKNHIELVAKTLAVLESLAANEHGKTLKEIAADVEQVQELRIPHSFHTEGVRLRRAGRPEWKLPAHFEDRRTYPPSE